MPAADVEQFQPRRQPFGLQVTDGLLATLTVTRGQTDDAFGFEGAAQPWHLRQPQPLIGASHDRDLRMPHPSPSGEDRCHSNPAHLAHTAQYPVGDRKQQRPQPLELLGPGHANPALKPCRQDG